MAIQQLFSLIDVKKNQRETKKDSKRGKEPLLDLHNKIKIITRSDEVFALWSELIAKYSQRELLDPETCEKMKLNSRWVAQKDGILSREFFKWLGNCDEEDHRKLILHFLHRSRTKRSFPYSKVTIKQPSKVLESCYSAKEWLERRKRKALVKRELNKIRPSLGLVNAAGAFQHDHWKHFKVDYSITSTAMRVLLKAPGEEYFVATKLTSNKNKPIEELSTYAKQFFTLFLRQKNNFQKLAARAYFRAYNASPNRMGSWLANNWELTSENLKLAVLDFRRVPGFVAKGTTSFANPYFMSFMDMFMQANFSNINELPAWLWICGNKETELQLHQLARHGMLMAKYVKKFSTYIPAKFERLEDLPATHRNARAHITLLFLIRHVDKDKIIIRDEFQAPNTPIYTKLRKYQELEYRKQATELRMEFYLQIFDLFCHPGDTVYSVFSGTKILCAGLVSRHLLLLVVIFRTSHTIRCIRNYLDSS